MSSRRQGDFLKELKATKTPHETPRFDWKKAQSGGKQKAPEALGFGKKARRSKPTEALVSEVQEHKKEIRKPR